MGKVHGATGLLLTLLTWWVGYKLLSENKTFTSLAQRCLLTMMALSLAEVVVGLSLVWIGIPAVMQVFHQWIASLYVGAAFTLTTWFYLTEGKAIELSVQRKEAVA
ncbi:MAG: hypothetical protein RML35_10475 [Chloroherpetonaceae bacterium]|nr:hypothetical protein [Chloroherpetonaceae bacterium]